jgi:hypothetical protein
MLSRKRPWTWTKEEDERLRAFRGSRHRSSRPPPRSSARLSAFELAPVSSAVHSRRCGSSDRSGPIQRRLTPTKTTRAAARQPRPCAGSVRLAHRYPGCEGTDGRPACPLSVGSRLFGGATALVRHLQGNSKLVRLHGGRPKRAAELCRNVRRPAIRSARSRGLGSFCAMFFNFAMSSAVQRRNVELGIG